MIHFPQEIYKIIDCALTELTESRASGRTLANPLGEAHYLGAWVTTAIKKKRFDSIALETLKGWQKQARSLGKNAGLKDQFIYLQQCYRQILDNEQQLQPVNIAQLNTLYAELTDLQWMVTTDLVVGVRLNRHSDGKDSLIVSADEIENNFDKQGVLINPLSLYIRGKRPLLIDLAFQQNLLLYKKINYKSKVKYHGEFIIYPDNDGTTLPEFPSDKNKEKQ